MPILHRLACFRDDVVFLIFLYQVSHRTCLARAGIAEGVPRQRWIYRIDPNRVNEYGQVMSKDVDTAENKEGAESKKNR